MTGTYIGDQSLTILIRMKFSSLNSVINFVVYKVFFVVFEGNFVAK